MSEKKKNLTVIIAGGGTGGHLFPGIAIAEELLKVNGKNMVMFVGTRHGIENRVLPEEGFTFLPIVAYGLFGKSVMAKIKGLITMLIGTLQSMSIIISKKPDIVVGVGGYASAPMLLAATLLRKKFLIQEQNSIPGFVNKIFGKYAQTVFIAFEVTKKYYDNIKGKVVLCGSPIREAKAGKEVESEFKKTNKFKLLVFGGSQGAHAINKLVTEMLPLLEEVKEKIFILHQTGKNDYEETKKCYEQYRIESEVKPFINGLHSFYAHADLIVSRSGASTIAEVTNYGKASIFIPFPFAVQNHQEFNAREVEKAGGAYVFTEKEANEKELAEIVLDLMNNPEKLKTMCANAAKLGRKDAAKTIVNHCYEAVHR
ncbi:MAG: undecaprenyldiphospho-muramoylpentapeptide beta-N-acetylglucosaminyltransferase [Nitrospinae bacterium]|nr:undecaprenyldiphospho-muramoylpentapeptide beta-N-acetylglucosaminyltransferase [Nitrospinota bacterium]